MAGTLVISTLSDGTNSTSSTNCIQGSAKAWCVFNGAAGTVRSSYNVSSVTRNGTGQYTLNFTNAFVDTYYCVSGSTTGDVAYPSTASWGTTVIAPWEQGSSPYTVARSTSSFRFGCLQNPGNGTTVSDPEQVMVSIIR